MIIRAFDNPSDFLSKSQDYIKLNEAANNLLLGKCLELKRNEADCNSHFIVMEESGRIVYVAALIPSVPVLMYCDRVLNESEMKFLIENICENKIPISGVIGPTRISSNFKNMWIEVSRCTVLNELNLNIYKLSYLKLKRYVNFNFRRADDSDIELVTQWIYLFKSDLRFIIDFDKAYDIVEKKINEKNLYILESLGKPVSIAFETCSTENGMGIVVYSPRKYYKKYFTICVSCLTRVVLDEGYKFCVLLTRMNDSKIENSCMDMGYQKVGEYKEYNFKYR